MRTGRGVAAAWVVALFLLVSGCAPGWDRPRDRASEGRLRAHVGYLASPALEGRRFATQGSQLAGRYVADHFRAAGLAPWDGGSYELNFPLRGVNVAGVLEGTDPELKKQVVLVVAHRDHLGKDGNKVYAGACDNAAGVAAVVELARGMARADRKPRRSVCFLITDGEEVGLLGAAAFAVRDDFGRVVATVNVDGLGRGCFDFYDDMLLLVGSERFPEVRREADGAALAEGLRLFPLGDDVLGARDDHAVFATAGVPSFFFTCGLYRDYHTTGDTAAKLDYRLLDRQARVVSRLVGYLADADRPAVAAEPQTGDRAELSLIVQALRVLDRFGGAMGLPAETRKALPGLMKRGEALLAGTNYSLSDRERFIRAVAAVAPAGYVSSPTTHWPALIECSLEGMRHLVKHRAATRPADVPAFDRVVHRTTDHLIRLHPAEGGRVALEAYITSARVSFKGEADGGLTISAGMRETLAEYTGTRPQIEQYCVDEWARSLNNATWGASWRQIATKVAEEDVGDYTAWRRRVGPSTRPSSRPASTTHAGG